MKMDAERVVAEVLRRFEPVSNQVGDSIFSGAVPSVGSDSTLPFVVTETTFLDPVYTNDREANLDLTQVSLYCYGRSNEETIKLAQNVRDAVSAYRGKVRLDSGRWWVQSIRIEHYSKEAVQRQTGSENWIHVGIFALRVWTSEIEG